MKKCKELYITNKRSNKTYYVARLAEDQNTIVIQRVYRAPDDVRTYHTLVSFADCGEYIFSAYEMVDRRYSVSSRTPCAIYESSLPDEHAKYRDYFVECITDMGNVLRVHIDDLDLEAKVFNKFVITQVEGNHELVVAYVDVDRDNELGIVLSGYPAGYEVA